LLLTAAEISGRSPDPRRPFPSDQLFEESPPFFELDRLDPVLDRLVDEVLLEAAAARFVPPEPFFAEERVLADFEPPRADVVDFFEAERVPVLLPVFEPPRDEDLAVPFADDFDALRPPAFEPVLLLDRAALFFAPPLLAEDLAAPLVPVLEDFFALLFLAPPFLAPPVFADEVPRFALDLVPFLAPEDELLELLLFPEVVVVPPPDMSVVFV
jgi:hypothetical protein